MWHYDPEAKGREFDPRLEHLSLLV